MGRQAVMSWIEYVGWRPLGFWLEIPAKDRRRAERKCRCEAEMIIFLRLADKAEREKIADTGVIAEQLALIKKDSKLHPEDYR